MTPDKRHLLHEVMDGDHDSRRAATLLAGGRVLRRRRQWRAASRGLAFALVLLAAGLWLEPAKSPRAAKPVPMLAKAPAAPVGPPPPQALTDAELLSLFPNTPVALATLADGRKQLIFPHPGDEQKFVIHL